MTGLVINVILFFISNNEMFYASCIDFNLSKYFRLKAKPDLPKLNIDEETDVTFVCLKF